jgi:cytochrome c oxidase subunit 3
MYNIKLMEKEFKIINKKEFIRNKNQSHFFHIVDPSPWPVLTSLAALGTCTGAVAYFHAFLGGFDTLSFSLIFLSSILILWFRDIIHEATLQGCHTLQVQQGLRLGFKLFIVSEAMFFFGFFWAFFHASLSPTIEIGSEWPPMVINVLSPFSIPLLNTLILLLSGCSITCSHHAFRAGLLRLSLVYLLITLFLAVFFLFCQIFEYFNSSFDISDGIYGSVFFMTTGFHGLHVFLGALLLFGAFLRMNFNSFSISHHLGFEMAIWYWHFVDVIWILLFLCIYCWGNSH